MSGQVCLKENGILDEDLPSLLENVFKVLSKNLYLMYSDDELNEIELKDDVVIPNEICDRFVTYNIFSIVVVVIFQFIKHLAQR